VMSDDALSAVLRSWEERFWRGADLDGRRVGRPRRRRPATPTGQALRLAAEQGALAPEDGDVGAPGWHGTSRTSSSSVDPGAGEQSPTWWTSPGPSDAPSALSAGEGAPVAFYEIAHGRTQRIPTISADSDHLSGFRRSKRASEVLWLSCQHSWQRPDRLMSISSTRADNLDAPARSERIYSPPNTVEGLVQANWVEVESFSAHVAKAPRGGALWCLRSLRALSRSGARPARRRPVLRASRCAHIAPRFGAGAARRSLTPLER
jgi:hypothetical protein